MFIITAGLPEVPQPTASECSTLLQYAEGAIRELETVKNRINEISDNPDDAMILIREQIDSMITNAKAIKAKLQTIQGTAENKAKLYTSGSVSF